MMMHMTWVIVTLVVFLLVAAGGVYITVRTIGARMVRDDHPTKSDHSHP